MLHCLKNLTVALVCALGAVPLGASEYTPPSSNPELLHPFGDHVYFTADDGIHGRELWRVDKAGNAEMVRDISPGPSDTKFYEFKTFKDAVYFRAQRDGNITRLWRTDGTERGTGKVLHHSFGTPGFELQRIHGGSERYLYLGWGKDSRVRELAYSDGTVAGTKFVTVGNGHRMLGNLGDTHVSEDGVIFMANPADGDGGVYVFDEGRQEAIRLTRAADHANAFMTLEDGTVHFKARTREAGTEYWITGGTPESTRMLADIYPGPKPSSPGQWTVFGQDDGVPTVFFAATHPETGRELWVTDGTVEGTRLFADLNPGAASSNPYKFTPSGKTLFFIASGDGTGKEVWSYTEGQEAPRMLADLYPGATGSEPYEFRAAGPEQLVFSALTPAHGEELWFCRDAHSEPELVRDLMPGPESSFPYYTTRLDDVIITAATGPVAGRELWIFRPESGELELLADIHTETKANPSSRPRQLTAAGDLIFFVANDIAHGNELWCTDGTRDGTRLVKDIRPGKASSNPKELTAIEDQLYFTADSGISGTELWRSDGTETGTAPIYDAGTTVRSLTRFGRHLLYSASKSEEGEELWILRYGENPKILADIAPGPASSKPRDFLVWKDHVYFRADDGTHGEELWRTDGTKKGTEMVRDIVAAPYDSAAFGQMSVTNGDLYVTADVGGTGMELWKVRGGWKRLELMRDIAGPGELDALRPQEGY